MSIGKHFAHISQLHPHPDNVRDDLGDISELAASIAFRQSPAGVTEHPEELMLRADERTVAAALAQAESLRSVS